MKNLILASLFVVSIWAQVPGTYVVSNVNRTGACTVDKLVSYNSTNGNWAQCQTGTWTPITAAAAYAALGMGGSSGGGPASSVNVLNPVEVQGRNPALALQSLQLDALGNLKINGQTEVQGRNPSSVLQSLQIDALGNLKVAGQAADCALSYSAASGTSGSSTDLDNRANSTNLSSCRYWLVLWQHPNTTSTTVTLQTAPDASGVPGTFTSSGLTANVGTQSTTEAIGYGSAILSGYAPWIRINYTSGVATTLEAKVFGWRVAPSEIFTPVAVSDVQSSTTSVTTQDTVAITSTGANGQVFYTGGALTPNSFASFSVPSGKQTMQIQVRGTWTGNMSVEKSIDNGITWTQATVWQGSPAATATTGSIFTANFTGFIDTIGVTNVRVRSNAIQTGTALVTFVATVNVAPQLLPIIDGKVQVSTTSTATDTVAGPITLTVEDTTSVQSVVANGQIVHTGIPDVGSAAVFPLANIPMIQVQVTGNMSGSNAASEISYDGGTTWFLAAIKQLENTTPFYTWQALNPGEMTLVGQVNTQGATHYRVRILSWGAGTVDVSIVKTVGPSSVTVNNLPVKPGSTPVASTDPAVVVDLRPNASVAVAPTSLPAQGIVTVATPALASSLVLKASAGNLYGVYATIGILQGYLMLFDSATVPADGPVSPLACVTAVSNGTTSMSYAVFPSYFSNGITVVFSTTGCFTKTSSNTVYIAGQVK